MPSEMAIGAEFGVSKIPVRQAIGRLQERGLVRRVPHRGTVVVRPAHTGVEASRLAVMYSHVGTGFFASPYYAAYLNGIEEEALLREKTLLLQPIDAEAPHRAFRDVEEDVAGFILVDARTQVYAALEEMLETMEKPVVLLGYEGGSARMESVQSDSVENVRQAVRFLWELGHRRITCLARRSPLDDVLHPNYVNRLRGYEQTMRELGGVPQSVILEGADNPDACRAFLERPDRPTAVWCTGSFALLVYEAAAALGLRIPQNLSVVAHDDEPTFAYASPPVTTIGTPLVEMGRAAVRAVLERGAANGAGHPRRQLYAGTLIPRGSHAACPG
ncbi:MAG: substrate-binding domain-containing protein [Kiritimatiellae bacterium]|nr:substrate-binding domain-containing protein [Kiritimatiellia bacterium]